MASFVKDSRYRHIEVKVEGRERYYDQLRVASGQLDMNNSVASNSKFIAYTDSSGGSSCVAVLPLTSVGKNHIPVTAKAYQQPLIRAHSQAVADLAFDPFDRQRLFTCSSDSFVKVWQIPEAGYVQDDSSPVLSLANSRSQAIKGLAMHPSARGLAAARGGKDITLMDLAAGKEVVCTAEDAFTSDITHAGWAFDGHVLTAMTKSASTSIQFIDFRAAAGHVVATTPAHTGARPSRAEWLGDSPFLITVGHSKNLDREVFLWDSRKLGDGPVNKLRIDGSTSPLVPLFDADSGLLTLAGKGDSSIRVYEFFNSSELQPIANYPVGDVTRGVTLMPKQVNKVMECEVIRILKLTDNSIQPISITVPRKEKLKFHEDLFPPTYSESPAQCTADEWMAMPAGEGRTPVRTALSSSQTTSSSIGVGSATASCSSTSSATPFSPKSPTATPSKDEDGEEVFPTSAKSGGGSGLRDSRIASMRFSSNILKFKHMFGKESPQAETFYNLKPNLSASDNPLIACSDTYWAIPYTGGGGPIYVSPLTQFGKVEPNCAVINGHKMPVHDISFSPFHSGLLATASADMTVKIWKLPEAGGKLTNNLMAENAVASINSHQHIVRTANFHPLVENLLCTTSQDMTLKLHNVESGQTISSIDLKLHDGAQVSNLSFNYDGSLFSLACKDRVIRLADPRTSAIVGSTPASSVLGRNLRAVWCSSPAAPSSNNNILSVSSAGTGMRTIHLWDVRNMETPLITKSIDNAAGQLYPMFDEDSGVCFIAGKGDTIVRYYELSFLGDGLSTLEKSNEFQAGRDPIAGICLLPKRSCNVRNIELDRLLKLTNDSVTPISFTVPRADYLKDFFQDDLYPSTRGKTSKVKVADWTSSGSSALPPPNLESLRPTDMSNASSHAREPESRSKVLSFKKELDKSEEEKKAKEDTFSKLTNLAIQRSKYHPNASGGAQGHGFKVDAAIVDGAEIEDNEWDD